MPKTSLPRFDEDEFKRTLAPLTGHLPSTQPVVTELRTLDDFASQIGRLWRESHERFIQIGEYLEQAKDRLQHGEFIAMIDSRLPFGRKTVHQLMTAAKAIKTGIVPPDLAPPSYSTVYLITTLPKEERQKAISEGVIRPNMRRADLVAFKRARRISSPPPPDPVHDVSSKRRAALEQERERLLAKQERIAVRLAAIEAELGGSPEAPEVMS